MKCDTGLAVLLLALSVTSCTGWRVVLKVAAGEDVSPATSLFDLWTSSETINDDAAGIAQVHDSYFAPATPSYKSRIVNSWQQSNIQNVKVGLYQDGREVVSIVFNSSRTDTMTSWFAEENIVQRGQRYTDLTPGTIKNCSAEGQSDLGHRFLVTSTVDPTCSTMSGWMIVIDKGRRGQCHWDYGYRMPFYLYSPNSTATTMLQMIPASVFVIFVDDCVDNPCQSGGTCHNNLGVTHCECTAQNYGHNCGTPCPCQYGTCVIEPADSQTDSRIFDIAGEKISCNCTAGHTGMYCDQDIDDCLGDPCLNDGICIDGVQSFICECPVGFHGTICELTRDSEITKQSTTGAIVAVAVVVPIVIIVIILAVAYGVYIKRNPDGYGRATIYKHSAMARDFVRRSFRRMSGRRTRQNKDDPKETTRDNKKIISSEQFTFGYDNSGFRENDVDDGFGDGDSSKRGKNGQDYIDLTPEDQSVISGESVGTKTPPNVVGYIKYLEPRQTGRSHSGSPNPYAESSQDSNTSGSLYQELNPGLTPDYGPAYQPETSPHQDSVSIQRNTPGTAMPGRAKDVKNQNVVHYSKDRNNLDGQTSNDRYQQGGQQSGQQAGHPLTRDGNRPDIVPHDRYIHDSAPRTSNNPTARRDDRYNTDDQPKSHDRYNTDDQPPRYDRYMTDQQAYKPRPVKLDFDANPRNLDKQSPARENRQGYSPKTPTSSNYSSRENPTSPGYSPGKSRPMGHNPSYPQRERTPSRESPGHVILDDGQPSHEINI